VTGPVFVPDGDLLIPQPVARAGWYADALHGGPVAAAFARAFERVPAPVEMTVTRLTVDLLRPVPTAPLAVTTEVVREGRRIQLLDAVMEADGTVVARASAMRHRTAEIPVPDHPRRDPVPGPDGVAVRPLGRLGDQEGEWFHVAAVEARFVEGDWLEPGPTIVWMRLTIPLVAGEDATPLQRVAAVSDFGNGLSRVLPSGWLYINSDLTVHLRRMPATEWICMRSRTDLGDDGVGLAQSELLDQHGDLGHALQSLVVDRLET
jgi:hypothetical protein